MKQVQLEEAVYLRALIYGNSGVGKTRLIGTACNCEDTYPLLVLNARGQPITLRLFEPSPLVLELEEVSDLNAPYNWFRKDQPWEVVEEKTHTGPPHPFFQAVHDFFGGEPNKFKMVAIDSITHLQRMGGDHIVGNKNVAPGDMPKALEGFGSWRKMLTWTANISNLWYQLPLHVVMTALTRHSEMPTLELTKFYPFLQGQSALEVPSHAEMVGRLLTLKDMVGAELTALKKREEESELKQAWNILITTIGRDYDAKWQGLEKQPPYVLEPTMQKLINILHQRK